MAEYVVLTENQLVVLQHFKKSEPMTVREAAQALDLSSFQISRIAQYLETQGYLKCTHLVWMGKSKAKVYQYVESSTVFETKVEKSNRNYNKVPEPAPCSKEEPKLKDTKSPYSYQYEGCNGAVQALDHSMWAMVRNGVEERSQVTENTA